MAMNTKIVNAEVIEITSFRGKPAINVKMENGRVERNLTARCIKGGFNEKIVVGIKGVMEYISSNSFGMWVFKPEGI
jgi:hypothetical protein